MPDTDSCRLKQTVANPMTYQLPSRRNWEEWLAFPTPVALSQTEWEVCTSIVYLANQLMTHHALAIRKAVLM